MSDPFQQQIDAVDNLISSDINKNGDGIVDPVEGIKGDKYDSLDLPMDDEALLKLKTQWEQNYASYETKMQKVFKRNLESYLGRTANGMLLNGEDNIVANLQFEAEETFLSAALAKNPEPFVVCDNTPEGNAIANAVKTMLQFHSEELVIRRKLALMVRQWSIYHLGVLKAGWNPVIDATTKEDKGDVTIENRKIQDFIFDPKGYVDAYGDFIGYLGERVTVSAEKLVALYPKHKGYITELVGGKMGTEVVYTEWWSADDTFTFTTFKDIVLSKNKNHYYKYPEELKDLLGEPLLDEAGEAQMTQPRNHFAKPKKPYVFLSVFSLQEQPHDVTGLIEQNIPNQNRITRQVEQIDDNINASNNGFAFSEDNFNQETAKQAYNARKKRGGGILIPSGGPIDKAILPLPAAGLPSDFFHSVETHKNDLRTSWGVQGILATPEDEDQTARGMILNQSHDTTRIGGGIGQSIEQVAENAFNWLTQLYYVFYDEPHFAAIMGSAKAVEYVTLSNADLNRQLIVKVAADSMVPKDPITEANQAQVLFDKGAIGPKTLLKMLDFPNADEAAADGLMYKIDPMAYMQMNFPEQFAMLQQKMMQDAQMGMQQAAQQKGMETAAVAQNTPPEAVTEPEQELSREPASAALSQVPLPA